MAERKVAVNIKPGIQARQAALFVQEANRFTSDIFIQKGDRQVNAKSIMGVMSLAIGKGTEITLMSSGNNEEQAIETLASFVEKGN